MANLSADTVHESLPRAGVRPYVLKNSEVVYGGSLIGIDADGFAVKWSNAALSFAGVALAGATGNTSASPKVEVRVNTSGTTLRNATVASVAQTNLGDLVYCSTDNPADLVLTPTSAAPPVGKVVRYVSSGVADVEVFASADAAQPGAGVYTLSFPISLASIVGAGDVVTSFVPGHAFQILSLDFHVGVPVTTGGDAATLNAEIGTTDLTGGAVALTSANCTPLGAKVAGTAITAGNVGSATDTVSIEASSVTAFAEGTGVLMVRIRNLEG